MSPRLKNGGKEGRNEGEEEGREGEAVVSP
jgi:hypothetical protein